MHLCIPLLWGSVGLRLWTYIGVSHHPLPTKTSRLVIHWASRSWDFGGLVSTCLFLRIFVAGLFSLLGFCLIYWLCNMEFDWCTSVRIWSWKGWLALVAVVSLATSPLCDLAGQVTGLFPCVAGRVIAVFIFVQNPKRLVCFWSVLMGLISVIKTHAPWACKDST